MRHPQEILEEANTERENTLWWELDKIAVEESNRVPASTRLKRMEKADAAEKMMHFLQKPTQDWQKRKFISEQG